MTLLCAATMHAQIPEVSGTPVDAATFRMIEIRAGDGAPAKPGQEYTVDYTGWLRDGTKFDSSVGKTPLTFIQGRRLVIAGFDVGFESMKVGGKRRLFIPYQFAYGELGRGPIPPKAELIFDVELLAVKEVPPPPSAAADLAAPFDTMQQQVLDLARAVPEEKYMWRPGEGVRSFRELFLHIAYSSRAILHTANGEAGGDAPSETAALTKEQVLAQLSETFASVREALEGASNGSLSRGVELFGKQTTRRGALAVLDTHLAEHLGQAIAYARVNGIVPPWSR